MKKILQIFLFFFITSCTQVGKENKSLVDLIPTDPILVLKYNSQKEINAQSFDNFLNKFLGLESESFQNKDVGGIVVKSFHKLGKNDIYSILFSENKNIDQEIAAIDSINYNGHFIKKSIINKKENFYVVKNGMYIESKSKLLIENSLRNSNFVNTNKDKDLKKLFEVANNDFSMFISNNFSNYLDNENLKNIFDISEIANWIQFDINLNQNKLILSGIGFQQDSINRKFNLLKKISPSKLNFEEIIPTSFKNFQKISYNHLNYISNLNTEIPINNIKEIINDSLYYDVKEIGNLSLANNTLTLFSLKKSDFFKKRINKLLKSVSVYRNFNLYEINDKLFKTKNQFFNIDNSEQQFCVFINNFFILSNNKTSIETLILNYTNSSTIKNSKDFQNSYINIPENSNFLNIYDLKNFDDKLFDELKIKKERYSFWINHMLIEDGLIYNNHSIIKSPNESNNLGPKILFNLKLNDEIYLNPIWVTNYVTKKKEIITQDKSNNLYLINSQGNIIWKKDLNEKIIGQIFQIDLYKNGRLQYAFTTEKNFLILDKNGNEVKKVKHKKNAKVVGLSVFDYDKIKNYRFLIAFKDEIKMLDSKMKIVKGFNKKNIKSNITKVPKHFRVGSKDYLVINTEKKLYILDRRGNKRIDVSQNLKISNSEIFLNKNSFIALKNNTLIKINTNGEISKTVLPIETEYKINSNNKNLVLIGENIIDINGQNFKVNYGSYSKPKISFDKFIYTVNQNENKLYLFDDKASLNSYFPLYGSGNADITKNKNNKYMIVVGGDKNEILAYELN
ncbi:MAG: hypothetical protein ACJ0OB_03485 [Flavobacteriaceae bacterium]